MPGGNLENLMDVTWKKPSMQAVASIRVQISGKSTVLGAKKLTPPPLLAIVRRFREYPEPAVMWYRRAVGWRNALAS
jgi:hypothetical protein